jgi:hypothetical protein
MPQQGSTIGLPYGSIGPVRKDIPRVQLSPVSGADRSGAISTKAAPENAATWIEPHVPDGVDDRLMIADRREALRDVIRQVCLAPAR